MEPTALQITWFVLFGLLIAGYGVLDGFDLGAASLSLCSRQDSERRLFVNAIAPVWDGNEVWLVTGGGALFAAFPPVYATVFSGFYVAFLLLLLALIFRAVSMEFRGKVESARWRRIWDVAFGVGSLVPALLYGVAVGNMLRGLPLDEQGSFTGTFFTLLHPFALLAGVLTLAMFVCHGAIYMALKSEGEMAERMKRWAVRGWLAWLVLYGLCTAAGHVFAPARVRAFHGSVVGWLGFGLFVIAMVYLLSCLRSGRLGRAFIASSAAIVTLVVIAGASMYPNLVPSLTDPTLSLTIANASSTPRTLTTMLIIALVGMPIVIAYTVFIYRVFKGKVVIDEHSY